MVVEDAGPGRLLRRSLAWAVPLALVGTIGIAVWCGLVYVAVAMGAGVANALFDLHGELSAAPLWLLWAQGSAATWLVALGGAALLSRGALGARAAGLLGGALGCGAGAAVVSLLS
jgi:hypothetical protein